MSAPALTREEKIEAAIAKAEALRDSFTPGSEPYILQQQRINTLDQHLENERQRIAQAAQTALAAAHAGK